MPTRVTLSRAVPCMRLIVANADQSADQSDIVQGCSLYDVDCC